MFKDHRYSAGSASVQKLKWNVPVDPGIQYEVRLYFAEITSDRQYIGARKIDVLIEGDIKLNNYDTYNQVGGYTGQMKSFLVQPNANLNVKVVAQPRISGIDVIRRPLDQCADGLDNDGDDHSNYPDDQGCADANDYTEAPDAPQCSDRLDNDSDGTKNYPADPGCSSATDTTEAPDPVVAACGDGVDNDSDDDADYPDDQGCADANDLTESPDPAACNDRLDNDGDGQTNYPADPGCSGVTDNDEQDVLPLCSNGIDDDADGRTDHPADPGCESTQDTTESPDPAVSPQTGPIKPGMGQITGLIDCDTVPGADLSPGDPIQPAVNDNSANTVCLNGPGLYKELAIAPEPGDTLLAEKGAAIYGGKVVGTWVTDGALWKSVNQGFNPLTQTSNAENECARGGYARACHFVDLFQDNVPLRHYESLTALGSGSDDGYFFDYDGDVVYTNRDRPETSSSSPTWATTATCSRRSSMPPTPPM